MITAKKEYKTFSTKGLGKMEVSFLAECEEAFLSGKEVTKQFLYDKAKTADKKDIPKLIEAFDYWEFMPKPKMYETLINPIPLSELLVKGGGNIYLTNSNTHDSWRVSETPKMREVIKTLGMLEGLTTYYELTNDCLYIKYDQIIGSRYIADIKNDFV